MQMRCCSVSLCTSHHVFTLRPCSQLDSRKTLCPRTGYPCHISQLYGMVYRVSGLDVRARFVFDWQYVSALRFPSALISPASRYERLISFFTPCSSRTLYVTLTPGYYCSVRPCQERRSRTGLCPTPARSTLSGLSQVYAKCLASESHPGDSKPGPNVSLVLYLARYR